MLITLKILRLKKITTFTTTTNTTIIAIQTFTIIIRIIIRKEEQQQQQYVRSTREMYSTNVFILALPQLSGLPLLLHMPCYCNTTPYNNTLFCPTKHIQCVPNGFKKLQQGILISSNTTFEWLVCTHSVFIGNYFEAHDRPVILMKTCVFLFYYRTYILLRKWKKKLGTHVQPLYHCGSFIPYLWLHNWTQSLNWYICSKSGR